MKSRRSEATLSRTALNPVIQLPVRSKNLAAPSCLAQDEGCFLPVTALAEQPQIIKMYFSAGLDNDDMDHAQSDCIELHNQDLSKQQGLFKCTTEDATYFVCLKVTCQPVQVCFCNAEDVAYCSRDCAPVLHALTS